MRMMLVFSLTLATLLCSACVSLEPTSTETRAPSRQGDLNALLIKAENQRQAAGTREQLSVLIETYETILEIDPEHKQTLSDLAQYHMLMGAAYSEDVEGKKQQFRKAIAYSERIMYLNSEFKRRVDAGQPGTCSRSWKYPSGGRVAFSGRSAEHSAIGRGPRTTRPSWCVG